jgi:hypothetical protein
MKNLIFILFLLSQYLSAQGIHFETEWKTAVEKATKEKKLIFMYAYKTVLPYYKHYEKEVFSDSVAGRFYNDNFINLRCDTDNGWGIKAAKHYQIYGSPDFVFIHPGSLEIYHKAGIVGQDPKFLLEIGTVANRERNAPPLSILSSNYDSGNRDMVFLRKLMQRKSFQNLDFTKEFMEFTRIFPLDELTKDIQLSYYNVKITYGSAEFLRLKKLKAANSRSSDAIGYILMASVNAIMDTAVKRKDAALMERMLIEQRNLDLTDKKLDYNRIEFYQKIEDWTSCFTFTETYMTQYLMIESVKSIHQRDSIAYQNVMRDYLTGKKDSVADKDNFEIQKMWSTHQAARLVLSQMARLINPLVFNVKDKESLKKMLTWSTRAVELEPQSISDLQTHAILLYKNGENTKAISLYSKALDLAHKVKIESDSDKLMDRRDVMREEFEKMKNGSL